MNALDEAHTIAIQFNAKHKDVQLQVVQIAQVLTEDEVRNALPDLKGWIAAASCFVWIRKRSPIHGEAVHAGRLLSKMGAETKKDGQMTLYRLDNLAATSAD